LKGSDIMEYLIVTAGTIITAEGFQIIKKALKKAAKNGNSEKR